MSQTASYNGLDTRVSATTNSVSQTYLRDGAYVTDPVVKDSSAIYTPGISERRGSSYRFFHSGLKNMTAQGSTSQTISATKTYDAFGNVEAPAVRGSSSLLALRPIANTKGWYESLVAHVGT